MPKKRVFSILLVSVTPALQEKAKDLGRLIAISRTSDATHIGLASDVDLASSLKTVSDHLAQKPAQVTVLLGWTKKVAPVELRIHLLKVVSGSIIIAEPAPIFEDLAKQLVEYARRS